MRAFSTNIEHETEENLAFRRVLFTGPNMQLVVMSLNPGEEIGSEVHPDIDQFFRIEKGRARIELDNGSVELEEDSVIVIPAGTRHNVINMSDYRDLKLCTIYTPPQHADGTVHHTKAEAEAAERIPAGMV
jgi:mannose-6-phosphate isomerase-like protein (cupin superfamily)